MKTCTCGCGRPVTGHTFYASDCLTGGWKGKATRNKIAAFKSDAPVCLPYRSKALSDAERDALDRAKRKSDLAADAALAERRRQVNADMLMARLMVGAVVPVIPTGYASPKVEYQPPQRARIFASDAASTWEG